MKTVDFIARCLISSTSANEAEDRAALAEIIDAGSKNLIHFNYPDNFVGLTFTKNNDGSVTVNGTVTSTGYLVANEIPSVSPDTELVLTGCPAGGGGASYFIVVETREPTQYYIDIGNGWSGKIGGTINDVRIVFFQGAVVDNLTFKPMLCTAVDYTISPKFVPYRPSYQSLYEMVQTLQAQIGNTTIKIISKEEYDSIEHDSNTIYYVQDGNKIVQYVGDTKMLTGRVAGVGALTSTTINAIIGNATFENL